MLNIITGNANNDSVRHRGWFIGHFITLATDPRSTTAIEVKWGMHKAGEMKSVWTKSIEATTLCLLIKGKFHISFPNNDFTLSKEGDYVIWPPDIFHRWYAENDSVVLTIRWPSKPEDTIIADEIVST